METQKCFKEKLWPYCVKSILAILIPFIFLNKVECQKADSSELSVHGGLYEKTFSTSRVGLAQSVLTTPKGEFHIIVLHRFSDISGDVKQFFGLDNAITRLGFEYGIFDCLSAGIGRSLAYTQTYDFSLKAGILKQNESNIPLSISWYLSVLENTTQSIEWTGHDSFGSRLSVVNQLIMARNQGIFSFQVSPMWLHSNYEFRKNSSLDIFALDLDSRIRLGEKLGIIAEYIPILTKEDFTKTNPFTIGLDINTGGHQFQLILSNSQGTNEKTILTDTFGSWSKGHIYFGFNLTRVFNINVH